MELSQKDNRAVTIWLLVVCALIVVMVVFGGYVRLTRSGLSIVEWNPISGVIPPIGEAGWQAEFAKYQQTPEFQTINRNMTLDGYKKIFYVEYIHRLIARFAGLIALVPLLYFMWRKIIPWRKSAVYVAIVVLFGFQGFLGWYMVSSGLETIPAVSHFRLTIHLLMALFLLALTLWVALNHLYGFPERFAAAERPFAFRWSLLLIGILVVQISYGGFVAGLKAGWVSNTFPLMFGRWIPAGLFQMTPWWENLFLAPVTVHFIHRWLAFGVLLIAWIFYRNSKQRPFPALLHKAILSIVWLVVVQISLGVSVVWFSVPLVLALLHQGVALSLFVVAVFINYQYTYEIVADSTVLAVPALKPT